MSHGPESAESLEPRLPIEMQPGLVKNFGTISLEMCDQNARAALQAQNLVSALPSTSQFFMSDIVKTKDIVWSHEFRDCVGLFAINAKGEMVACHLPKWDVSERSAIDSTGGAVLNILAKQCAEGETFVTRHKKGGWERSEKRGNPYGLSSGDPKTISAGSEFEHIYPTYRDYEKVTVQFRNGRKILTDTFEGDRNYLRERGMWDEDDEAWFQKELAKLGNEDFITDRAIIGYFSGMTARITMRALKKQVQKLGRDTEVYIIGGQALDSEKWVHYKNAVASLDTIAMQATGNHATVLTPPSMRIVEKGYDIDKAYLFDPEARKVYAFGFSKIVQDGKPDVLPFGVPAEWVSEVYEPYFNKFSVSDSAKGP